MTDLSLSLPASLDDAAVEAQKAGNRGILLRRLEGLIALCEAQLEGDELGGQDIRWAELKLRCLDRVGRLLRVDRVDVAAPPEEVDAVVDSARKVDRLIAAFDDLEVRAAVGG